MSVTQAAKMLGVSVSTVYRLCEDGELGHTRVRRRRITITPEQITQYRNQPQSNGSQWEQLQ